MPIAIKQQQIFRYLLLNASMYMYHND